MNPVKPLTLALCLLASTMTPAETTLTLGTTDWCPYACPDNATQPGIAHEYLTAVFKQIGVTANIKFFPWARAIESANTGEIDGLLTAVKGEAPDLAFTTTPTMSYRVCFFTDANNSWTYQDVNSLKQVKLGVIKDYAYGEPVDAYLKDSQNQANITSIAGTEGIKRLFSMLELARVKAIVEDPYVVGFSAKQQQKALNTLKNAGCLAENPFYLALNSKKPEHSAIIEKLNAALSDTKNKTLLDDIVKKYTQ